MAWVRLNVGGEMMETALATVTKYPDSQLAKMFLSAQESSNTEDRDCAKLRSGQGDVQHRLQH